MTFQAVAKLSNTKQLCVGEITAQEAETATASCPSFDGTGLYLVCVDSQNPKNPAEVLAKFADEYSASILANLFRMHGLLEA